MIRPFLLLLLTISLSADIRIQGSTTILPIAKHAAQFYTGSTGIAVEVKGGGSSRGIAGLLSGECDIATVSKPYTEKEKQRLLITPLAYDGLAFIVHDSNPRNSITAEEVISIYKGDRTHWEDGSTITVVDKNPGRGTKQVFDNYFPIERFSPGCYHVGSNTEALLYVATDSTALSYVSIGAAIDAIEKGLPVKMLMYEGHMPTLTALKSGAYPLVRTLSLATRHNAGEEVQRFVSFLSGPEGTRFIQQFHYIPLQRQESGQ